MLARRIACLLRPSLALFALLSAVGCGRLHFAVSADASTPRRDAGAVRLDAGDALDAAASIDAGASTDTGATIDAGVAVDAGAPLDTGTPTDAGAPFDAGNDAGSMRDAGVPIDAGPPPMGTYVRDGIVNGAGEITALTFGSAGELYATGFGRGAAIDTGRDTAVAPAGTSYGFAARYEAMGSATWGHFLSRPDSIEPRGIGHVATYGLLMVDAATQISFGGLGAAGGPFTGIVGYTDVPGVEEIIGLPPYNAVEAIAMATSASGAFTMIGADRGTGQGFYATFGSGGPPTTRVTFSTSGRFHGVARAAIGGNEVSLIGGEYRGTAGFAGHMLTATGGVANGFVVGVAADGTVPFTFEVTASAGASVERVAFTPEGNVALAGEFTGETTIGGLTFLGMGGRDVFVVYGVLDGTFPALTFRVADVWVAQSPGDDVVKGLAVIGNEIYALGEFAGTMTVGADTQTSDGVDLFLGHFNRSTTVAGVTSMSCPGNDTAYVLSAEPGGMRLAMGYRAAGATGFPWIAGVRTTANVAAIAVFDAP